YLDQAELDLVARELGEETIAIGDADVAPHLGMARSDAREIAEATRGIGEELLGIRPTGDVVHQRIGEDMRQVANSGEDGVVLVRLKPRAARATGFPQRLDFLYGRRGVLLQRREHDAPPAEKL